MARAIFIDSGAWLAMADTDDPFHSAAIAFYRHDLRQWPIFITTNFVCAEAYALIRPRSGHSAAMRFLLTIQNTVHLEKVFVDKDIEADAAEILRRYDDQSFSYTDAVSFAVMRQRKIADAFAFDQHFATAGFTLLPASAR